MTLKHQRRTGQSTGLTRQADRITRDVPHDNDLPLPIRSSLRRLLPVVASRRAGQLAGGADALALQRLCAWPGGLPPAQLASVDATVATGRRHSQSLEAVGGAVSQRRG